MLWRPDTTTTTTSTTTCFPSDEEKYINDNSTNSGTFNYSPQNLGSSQDSYNPEILLTSHDHPL